MQQNQQQVNKRATTFLWLAGLWANLSGLLFTLIANRFVSLEYIAYLGLLGNFLAVVSIVSVAYGVTTNRFFADSDEGKLIGLQLGKQMLLIGSTVSIVLTATSFWWLSWFSYSSSWLSLLFSAFVFLLMFPIAWMRAVLQATLQFRIVAIGLFIDGFFKLVLGAYASYNQLVYEWLVFAFPISSLVVILTHWVLVRSFWQELFNYKAKKLLPGQQTFLFQAILQRIGVVLLLMVDVLAANFYLPVEEAGLYALISLVGKMVYFGTQSLYTLITPIITPLLQQERKRKLVMIGIITLLFCMSLVVMILATVLPQYSFELLIGPRFQQVAEYLPLYIISVTIVSFLLVFSLYKLLMQQYQLSIIVCFAVVLELFFMSQWHSSIKQITENVFFAALIALVLVLYNWLYPKVFKR